MLVSYENYTQTGLETSILERCDTIVKSIIKSNVLTVTFRKNRVFSKYCSDYDK